MAFDTDVYFKGAPANLSPAQYAQMGAQTDQMHAQTQKINTENQQAQQNQSRQQTLQSIAQEYQGPNGFDSTAFANNGLSKYISRTGDIQGAQAIHTKMMQDQAQTQQMQFAATKEQRVAQEQQIKNLQAYNDHLGQSVASLLQLPDEQTRAAAYPQKVAKAKALAPQYGIDPSQVTIPDQYPGEAGLRQAGFETMKLKDQLDAMLHDVPESEKPSSDLGKLAADHDAGRITDSEYAGSVRKHNALPRNSTTINMGGAGASGQADPNAALAKLSLNDQSIVKQLAERKLLIGRAGGFTLNSPRNQALYGLATQLNPSLSVADNAAYQDFVKDLAKSSPTSAGGRVDAGNRMLGHAGDLIDALENLEPGSGVTGRIGNVLAYPGQKAFGSAMGPVSFIKSKLLGEVNKLVTGGVPHAKELEDDVKNMPDTATKEQWGQVIKSIADVGLEQVTSTEEKRNNFLGNLAPSTSLLSDKAQKNLAKIYKYAGSEPPTLPTPSGRGYTEPAVAGNTRAAAPSSSKPPTKVSSKAEYDALPSGAAYIAKDGSMGRKP